jgi:Vitamin K-dependent gamma-carboxylase
MTAIWGVTLAAGVLSLIGLFTRPALLVHALGIWFLIAHRFSYGDVHHSEAAFALFLMSLAFAPSGERLSVDAWRRQRTGRTLAELSPYARWPFALAHLLLALMYFSTGITKLIFGGLRWMNGYTLQIRTLQDALARDIPLGMWLAQHHTMAILLSIGTVAFEVGFWTSLFLPRWKSLYFAAALAFHVGLHLVAGHGFFKQMAVVLILLICYDSPWLRPRLRPAYA